MNQSGIFLWAKWFGREGIDVVSRWKCLCAPWWAFSTLMATLRHAQMMSIHDGEGRTIYPMELYLDCCSNNLVQLFFRSILLVLMWLRLVTISELWIWYGYTGFYCTIARSIYVINP
jgi:hypothetical protein